MKVLKTLKKYFSDGLIKIISSLTTDYSIYSSEYNKYLDEVVADNSNWIKVLKNFNQPIDITINEVENWNLSGLKCTVIGNMCYLQGRIYHSAASTGEYNLALLPLKIRPNVRVDDWSGVIINGIDYKTHFTLSPDNSNLNLYFYDEVPAGIGIPINFSFVLTTQFTGF